MRYAALVNEDALAAAIGARVRQHRQAHGWTLDQFAQISTVSRRMIVSVEQGEANPSIATLLKLSDALGVGLPALVEPPHATLLKVTRSGEGAALWTSDAGGRAVLVAGTSPPEVVELWEWTLGPGDTYRSDAHSPGTKELIHVWQGAVAIEAGDQSATLKTGDAVAFPGDVAHAYLNPSRRPAKFSLAVFEPGVSPQKGH